ncbi:hypothetical protein FHR99_001917 [Litorivivens lipolytica]|uniref:Outer membrane protein beta-barrel domain-containing protein n=1 Tax=Litorivivens lipolytica TaxID=1524264 RepID=A0A7W4W539_9GAMM|nr:hypothetical protein [Litorivivens lipolytica]MBB3047651.1 hypothetical protein [Litorivivens lipolytica]
MYRSLTGGLLTLLLLTFSTASQAQITTRLQASDIGLGAEVGYRWESPFGLRAGFLVGDLDVDFEAEDNNGIQGDELEYDSDVDLENSYLLADWHPWNGIFRVSAGTFFNNSGATVITRCNAQAPVQQLATCEFGNSRYSSAVLGEVTTKVDFDQVAPYLGIGWGHRAQNGFAFNADLGVIHVGAAKVEMTSSGSCGSDPQCREQIEQEEKEIQDELDKYEWLPFVSLGVSYHF